MSGYHKEQWYIHVNQCGKEFLHNGTMLHRYGTILNKLRLNNIKLRLNNIKALWNNVKSILAIYSGLYSLLVDPSPFKQFGADFGTGQFTKEQEVISTERAQDIVVTKDSSCDARR